jgi:gamma-glutamylcysteine synthetase
VKRIVAIAALTLTLSVGVAQAEASTDPVLDWALHWKKQASTNIDRYNRRHHTRVCLPEIHSIDALHMGRTYRHIAFYYAKR